MPPTHLQVVVVCYAVGINLAAYLVFAWDKYCAQNNRWRVPESTLLLLALVGGTVGALIGKWTLRHKTRKQPFVTHLRLIISIQAIFLVTLSFPQGRRALSLVLQAVLD